MKKFIVMQRSLTCQEYLTSSPNGEEENEEIYCKDFGFNTCRKYFAV